MNNIDYVNFYIRNNPYFTDIVKINKSFVCLNRFGKDYDNNCAFLFDDSKTPIEKYFKALGKVPAIYNIELDGFNCEKELQGYEFCHEDVWLTADVNALCRKFSFFKCPSSVTLERIDEENYQKQNEVSKAGFSASGNDNPYGDVDLTEYSAALKEKFDRSQNDELVIFLINFSGENVGVLNLNIESDVCYIAGFTIKPEYRRTKVFFVLKLLLDFLKTKCVKHILCLTESGGYPNKIYNKLGFSTLFSAKLYKCDKNM